MFLQYTHSFTGIFFLRSMCSVACCCSDILFWPRSCHQAALAFYKSQCKPTNLSVNEMLHFIVMQSGIIKKQKKQQLQNKTTNMLTHAWLLPCSVQSFLLPPILNACINAARTSFGSFMFVLFDRWGFRNLIEEFLSQFYSVKSGRISLCVSHQTTCTIIMEAPFLQSHFGVRAPPTGY